MVKKMDKTLNKNLISIAGILGSLAGGALIALAGSQNGALWMGLSVFALCCAIAFIVQWLLFIPAFVYQTERYFDLAGSLTYISLVLVAWLLSGASDPRSLIIGGLVIVWACRLGTFLFGRVSAEGEDRRFRSIKPDFLQFLMTWTLQGLWVSVTLAAGLAAMTAHEHQPIGLLGIVGILLWVVGFSIEVTADNQKQKFKRENPGEFITIGLWRFSRHPNYFGEIVLWLGIAVLALPALQGWQYATLISPIFVIFLLTKISGVRMLEHRANKKWGEDPEYQFYRSNTPVLVPRFRF
jgi:steroid 5-alpha reductase family enzyme